MSAQIESGGALPAAGGADSWIIEPRGRKISARATEVWRFRRLFRYFGRRAIERRYQGTALGMAWLFILPLLPLALRALIFGGVLGVAAPGVPYFLFLLVGSSIWELFSTCLMWATRSLQLNRAFLGRMYFPRIILPAATMAIAFVNFLIFMAVLAGAIGYYYATRGQLYLAPPAQMVWGLVSILLAVTLAFGVGLWTAPMNAQYRDVRFTLVFILEFWWLLTPVLYPLSAVPAKYHWLVFVNPMAGIVQAFKWGTLGIEGLNTTVLAIDAGVVLLVLISGLWFFGRMEGQAVDRI